jgi:hypothetical protein
VDARSDPVSATWSPGASMAVGRTYFTATVLQNGAVLVTAPSVLLAVSYTGKETIRQIGLGGS